MPEDPNERPSGVNPAPNAGQVVTSTRSTIEVVVPTIASTTAVFPPAVSQSAPTTSSTPRAGTASEDWTEEMLERFSKRLGRLLGEEGGRVVRLKRVKRGA